MVNTKDTYSKWKCKNPVLRQLVSRRKAIEKRRTRKPCSKMDGNNPNGDENPGTSGGSEIRSLKSALQINVPTKNQYEVLQVSEPMEAQASTSTNAPKQDKPSNKKVRPPAIVLHNKIGMHSSFIKTMDVHVTKGYHIKNSKNHSNIFINDC